MFPLNGSDNGVRGFMVMPRGCVSCVVARIDRIPGGDFSSISDALSQHDAGNAPPQRCNRLIGGVELLTPASSLRITP